MKRYWKATLSALLVLVMGSTMIGCSVTSTGGSYAGPSDSAEYYLDIEYYPEFNTEEYTAYDENGFQSVAANPTSTFSGSVDTASYANLRRMINEGYKLENIPSDAVRTEEFLNYFKYDFVAPAKD